MRTSLRGYACTAVALLTVHIQPVAACGLTNGVVEGHSVLMFAATLVFALAAGTVTLITVQPQSAMADPSGGGFDGHPEPTSRSPHVRSSYQPHC